MADETIKGKIKDKQLQSSGFDSMIDEIKTNLTDDNQKLYDISAAYNNLVSNASMESETISAVKTVALDYSTAVTACISANELDLVDITKLSSILDGKDYDGNEIIAKMEEAEKNADEYARLAEEAYQRLCDLDWWQVFSSYGAMTMFNSYKRMEAFYRAEYDCWLKIATAFYNIINNSENLFSNSKEFRTNAETGFAKLSSAYQNHEFNTDYDRTWHKNLGNVQDSVVNSLTSQWKDQNGYDWDAITKFLKRDSDKVSGLEYIAFANLLQDMPLNEIENLFENGCADVNTAPLKFMGQYETLSPVLKKAIEVNLALRRPEAELSLFMGIQNGQADRISAQLTKAELLYQIFTHVDEKEVRTSVSITEDGKNYKVSLTTVYTTLDTAYVVSESLFVYDYLIDVDKSLTESTVANIADSLGVDFVNDCIYPNVRDYIITSILNSAVTSEALAQFSIPGTAYTFAVSGINTMLTKMQNEALVNMVSNDLEYISILEALCIQANVTVSSDTKVGATLDNPHFYDKQLVINLAAYNYNQGTDLTLDELKEYLSTQPDTVKNYIDWYTSGGSTLYIKDYERKFNDYYDDVYSDKETKLRSLSAHQYEEAAKSFTEYEKHLQNIYNDIRKSLPKDAPDYQNLSYEQHKELVKSYEDPNYEIDKTEWEN